MIFTVQNQETNAYRTFRIKSNEALGGSATIDIMTQRNSQGIRWYSLGFYNGTGGKYSPLVLFKNNRDSRNMRIVEILSSFNLDCEESQTWSIYELLPSRQCIKCGEALTSPDSIRYGIGPICAGEKFVARSAANYGEW